MADLRERNVWLDFLIGRCPVAGRLLAWVRLDGLFVLVGWPCGLVAFMPWYVLAIVHVLGWPGVDGDGNPAASNGAMCKPIDGCKRGG